MKSRLGLTKYALAPVAPFAGAWIEIMVALLLSLETIVAPFAGAWIEMVALWWYPLAVLVAPFAGAWIEMDQTA